MVMAQLLNSKGMRAGEWIGWSNPHPRNSRNEF